VKAKIKKYSGELILILSSLVFSFEWFFIRNLTSRGYSTFDIVFVRAFGALLLLSIILPIFFRGVLNFKKINKSDLGYFVSLGFIAVITNSLFNLALKYTTVANVMMLLYLSVFWGIIFGFIFLKEKSSIRKVIYTILAFLGICLVLVKGKNEIALSLGVGELLAFITSFVWTADSVIARKIKHTNPFFRMFFIYIVMSIVSLVVIVSLNNLSYLQKFASPDFLVYGLGLAITAGVLGKGLMYLGINRVPVSIALVIMLLEPISQMTTAYFFADEKISFINLFGIIAVFIMIILISKKTEKSKELLGEEIIK